MAMAKESPGSKVLQVAAEKADAEDPETSPNVPVHSTRKEDASKVKSVTGVMTFPNLNATMITCNKVRVILLLLMLFILWYEKSQC